MVPEVIYLMKLLFTMPYANLNGAFAGEPWHTSQYSGGFTHPYTDSNIEFCLASIDPDGNHYKWYYKTKS
jgi:hypothetical protein